MTNDLVLSSFRISTPAHIERNEEALLPISSNAITTFSDMGFGSFFLCSSNDFPMKNLPASLLEAGKELCSHVVLPTTADGLLNENVVTSNVDHMAVVAKNSGCKRRKIKNELLPPKRSQKLGSRITLLQQLVSPFGKTDTASVLSETSLYIKDLHDKIEVLTMPFFTPNYLLWKGSEEYCLGSRGLCVVPIKFVIDTMGDILHPDQRTTFGSNFY